MTTDVAPERSAARTPGAGRAETLRTLGDRLVASDPGLNRLRMAVKALVAVASTLAVEWVFVAVTGQTVLIAVMIGAVVAMMGSMALNDATVAGKAVTAVFIRSGSRQPWRSWPARHWTRNATTGR